MQLVRHCHYWRPREKKWDINTHGERICKSSGVVEWVVNDVGQCQCVCTSEIHAVQEPGATGSGFV